jgi:hypothetical protein
MLPPFLGQLLTVATAGALGLAMLLVILAGLRGSWLGVRIAAGLGAAVFLGYAGFFGLGLLLAKDRVLPPGEALQFCGLDCHLHVQVSEAHPGAVTVRFSSNAVRAPEFPAELAFALRDSAGKLYQPLNEVPDRVLGPGESWIHTLRFAEGTRIEGGSLIVTWKRGLDYLVPGAGNPLVQRHTRLALPAS